MTGAKGAQGLEGRWQVRTDARETGLGRIDRSLRHKYLSLFDYS